MPKIILDVVKKEIRVHEPFKIVTNNSDYELQFNFDEEWSEFDEKTLRISFETGDYIDTKFSGNTVALPVILNQKNFRLGVYAGDIHSTMVLVVYCKDSILENAGYEYIVKPTESIEITNTEEVDVTHYATAQVVDNDLVAGNIRKGANVLGIEGDYEVTTLPAENITYDNSTSGLTATDVQAAIDELAEGSGGSEVVINPTLAGTEARMTGIEVDGVKYKNDYLPTSGGTVNGDIKLGDRVRIVDNQSNNLLGESFGTVNVGYSSALKLFTNSADINHSRNGTDYNVLDSYNTQANPTLAGTENRLTGIKINGTSYKNDYLPLSGGTMSGIMRFGHTGTLIKSQDEFSLISMTGESPSRVCLGDGFYNLRLDTTNNDIIHRRGGTNYNVLDDYNTQANPTLAGTETELTALKLDGTNYKVGGNKLYAHHIVITPSGYSGKLSTYIINSSNVAFTHETLSSYLKDSGLKLTSSAYIPISGMLKDGANILFTYGLCFNDILESGLLAQYNASYNVNNNTFAFNSGNQTFSNSSIVDLVVEL